MSSSTHHFWVDSVDVTKRQTLLHATSKKPTCRTSESQAFHEMSYKCQLLKRAGISITWNCSANRKLHCETFCHSFYENLKKKNGYCALNLNEHIIQVQSTVTETILDSFFEKKGCNEKHFKKHDAVSNPYTAKNLTTLYFKLAI